MIVWRSEKNRLSESAYMGKSAKIASSDGILSFFFDEIEIEFYVALIWSYAVSA